MSASVRVKEAALKVAARRAEDSANGKEGRPVPPDATESAFDGYDAPESTTIDAAAEIIDRAWHANIARFTGGLSPGALASAYFDWIVHLAAAPGKQGQLVQKSARKAARLSAYVTRRMLDGAQDDGCITPLPQDRRFRSDAWRRPPFNFIAQSFLLTQQWWHNATTGVPGVSEKNERIVEFASRQVLDIFSPSNFVLTNPEVLNATMREGGLNLVRGFRNFVEDWSRQIAGAPPVGAERFVVGRDVAATPGKVVFRNRLIELIQYAPATEKVRPEPILITPAWIMKYYVLDLSPRNSLVKYLVEQGFTVFMISWKNPGVEDRDLGFDDYRKLGVMAALDAIGAIMPGAGVHAAGYCLGGTLLSIAAAAMACDGDERLKSVSLLAAQQDFTEAGELTLFINESQVDFLEDMMWGQGYLDSKQMAGAFQLLRSNDLIWSKVQREYLLGQREPMTDLMAWNADATRMPYRMHSEYLRSLFLHNDLAEGRFRVEGAPVAVSDIRAPIFAVGTTNDHVAPWRSAFKVHLLADTSVTFLLTNGGHNAGIVSEPGHAGRKYRLRTTPADAEYLDPVAWLAASEEKQGSWWPEWARWLAERSGPPEAPPPMGGVADPSELVDAPGEYVHMR
ncbi:MAG: alpha/beta fold hydrolase [Alphaproteobacteria bacterium]|nr:alpha/beta fold hydrolase [Alphaproteobacteria bacterium]